MNAKIIYAAPDLLKTCERILDAIKWKNMTEENQIELLQSTIAKTHTNAQTRKPAPWKASNPTLGPWTHQTHRRIGSHPHLEGKPALYDVELVVSEVGEHSTPICQMDQSTEACANARLAAASWDLLKACSDALVALDNTTSEAFRQTAIANIRFALSKALPA